MSGLLKNMAAFIAARKLSFSIFFALAFIAWLTYYDAESNDQFFRRLAVILFIFLFVIVFIKMELKVLARKIKENRDKVSTIIFGKTAYGILGFPFDYILYPFVVTLFGLIFGGCLMMAGSGIICYLFLCLYDRMKVDWLGIELVKENIDSIPQFLGNIKALTVFGKIIWLFFSNWVMIKRWFLKKGGMVTFLYVAAQHDPLYVVVYFRKNSFSGMTGRDKGIFFAGIVVSNTYWTLWNYFWIWAADKLSQKYAGFSIIEFIRDLF